MPKSIFSARRLAAAGVLFFQFCAVVRGASNVVIWDTGAPLAGAITSEARSNWKEVPSNLFTLEADPPKAASDPGYYGREYSFKGDAVVENRLITAAFASGSGRIAISSKNGGKTLVELSLAESGSAPVKLSRFEVVRNVGDEVVLKVFFGTKPSDEVSAMFSFGRGEIVEIAPSARMRVNLRSPIDYGVVPSFIGDDLIYRAADYGTAEALDLPSENMFLGLLRGEQEMLVMTWPKGKQGLKLKLADQEGARRIESLEFDTDGQSFYLAALQAPGIWHREELKPGYLEKDVTGSWKRPFPARWVTQLSEAGVRTTFTFREGKSQVWRGVPGSYNYPVWFEGDAPHYLLSKKVPPKGESLIYFREGEGTPETVRTPVDILRETLGRQTSETILDPAGRKLRTHHRRGGAGVHRACTCGCTEAIQVYFEKGTEVEKREEIVGALDDMIYFVRRHLERIDEYRKFADDTLKLLRAQNSPEVKAYVEIIEPLVRQIPEEYNVQLENMKSLGHADELSRRTLALTSSKEPGKLPAYMALLKEWRGMGGAQDYIVAECHMLARKIFQEAGYACATRPQAVALAGEIRAKARQCLRNPDGYEIWPDY